MRPRPLSRGGAGALACLLAVALAGIAAPVGAAPSSSDLQAAFRAAAHEFGVPEPLLLAVSYNESQWESHGGQPSTSGAFGVMGLTDALPNIVDGRGDGTPRSPVPDPSDLTLRTLRQASQLLGISADTLKTDPAQNIRGGAALLARDERRAMGDEPADVARWYAAAVRYSGATDAPTARAFADDVFATIDQGASRTTGDRQQVTEQPQKVQPDRSVLASLGLSNLAAQPCPDVPAWLGLQCQYVPAAYQVNDPQDDTDYGNYDLADRTPGGQDNGMPRVQYIVMHDNEGTYGKTLTYFQDPHTHVSAHFEVRSSDGQIAQLVPTRDIAWHAGDWYVNMHSIGIEQEGFGLEGATWYTEQLYHASARLVRYLAFRYGVPLDRMHILGHDDVPGPTASTQQAQHWDPGPYWNWDHFMDLLGSPIPRLPNLPGATRVIAITPDFQSNQPPVTCDPQDEHHCNPPYTMPPQPSNFVYLRTAPSENAPLVRNPNLPAGWNPLWDRNWGDKASTGQLFVAAGRQGDWQGVYFSGQVAWFHDPPGARTASGSLGETVVTPRPGLASIPVYGRAYPEAAAYPTGRPGIQVQPVVSFDSIPAGQSYVGWGPVAADFYNYDHFATQLQGSDYVDVVGRTRYYEISFNHRVAYVQAGDVTPSPS